MRIEGRPRQGLAGAFGLLTIVGGAADPTPAAVAWFPAVGAALGGALGVAWWGLGRAFPPLVVAAVVVAADLGLTGCLHIDGLIDSADGLLPHLGRVRRLEVMAEPQAGAFGVAAAAAVIGLRFAAFASLSPATIWKGVLLVGGIWTASRSIMALATVHLAYARPGGLAEALRARSETGGTSRRRRSLAPVVGLMAAGAAIVAWHPAGAPAVIIGEVAGCGAVLLLGVRRLGGYTGDVLGASGILGETLALILSTAKW